MITEVYDLETLSNLFTYTGYCLQNKQWYQFVIHNERNDAELLYVALTRLKGGSPCAIYILCTESNLIGFGNKWNTYYNKNES